MTSLGLLEVKGLAMAVVACDTMLKSSNVKLLNHENTKGGGWITVKILGDVAAVQAALDAGEAVARQHNALVSKSVIARPNEEVHALVQLNKA